MSRTRNQARSGIGLLMVVAGVLLALSGCKSLTPKPPTIRFVGTEVVRKMDSTAFLECTSPEANEMLDRKVQRSAMSRRLYHNDKANRDQPTDLTIPTTFTLSSDAYRRLAEQGEVASPHFELQIRKRRQVLVAKVYEATTPLHDSSDQFVRKDVSTEVYPRFYDWVWHPECRVVPDKPIRFQVENLPAGGGLVSEGEGVMDQFGRMFFDLRPYIEVGLQTPEGIRLVFTCPSEGLHAVVVVPQEVFASF